MPAHSSSLSPTTARMRSQVTSHCFQLRIVNAGENSPTPASSGSRFCHSCRPASGQRQLHHARLLADIAQQAWLDGIGSNRRGGGVADLR